MARLAVLAFTEIAQDPRVLRHIDALREQHDVITCGKGPAPDGVVEHLRVRDEAVELPRRPGVAANLASRRFGAAYESSEAAEEAARLLSGAEFDLLLANDVLALPCGFAAAGDRPFIADMHEYAPRQFNGLRWRMTVGPFFEALCREFLPQAAIVTTVADGIAAEFRRNFGVEVVTVTNAAPFRRPTPRRVGDIVRLVHTGAAQPNRNLELMILAAADLSNVSMDLYLVASHGNRPYRDHLRRLASNTSNVHVLDPVPMAELPAALDSYDVGVYILAPTSFNNEHALPNKFFDFVQSGLGVLIGPSPEMAALTERHGLGRVLPDFSQGALRIALESLEPAEVAGWKTASCAAALELSSQHQSALLQDTVDNVLGG